MTVELSVAEFVRTGRLGSVSVGCSEAVVQAQFGSAEDVGHGFSKAIIHRHGQGKIEISLIAHSVVLIAVYLLRGAQSAGATTLADDLPSAVRDSAAELESWLNSQGIRFRAEGDDELYWVRTSAGVTATFFEGRLDSLQAT